MAQVPGDRRRPTPASTAGLQTTAQPANFWSKTTTFSPLGSRLDALRQTPAQLRTTITRGGRTYKEIDNGIANVLVPTLDPGTSQAEVAANRAAADRALFMAQNPLAGAAYGVATLAGASPPTRDRAMMAGAVADAGLSVATPRGADVRRPTPPIKTTTAIPQDGSIRYREANSKGQSRGVNAALGAPMLGTGGKTKQNVKPPGFISGKEPYYHNRAHLLANRLGGHADELKEVFAATRSMNSPIMSRYESSVARRVASGELIDYSVTPHYTPGVEAPSFVTITAWGDREGAMAVILENPLGRPKK